MELVVGVRMKMMLTIRVEMVGMMMEMVGMMMEEMMGMMWMMKMKTLLVKVPLQSFDGGALERVISFFLRWHQHDPKIGF